MGLEKERIQEYFEVTVQRTLWFSMDSDNHCEAEK
jgi:hypothetical protein